MERKKSVVAAGIITGGLLVASAAYALTGGILAGGTGDGAGSLAPVVATTTDVTPATAPAADPGAPTTVDPNAAQAVDPVPAPVPEPDQVSATASTAAERYDDDAHDSYDEHESHDDSHEADEQHYEGRDDDD